MRAWIRVTVALVAALPAGVTGVEAAEPGLPLGRPNLPESRSSTRLAPGVTYTKIERGFESSGDFFTVDVTFAHSERDAEAVAARLERDGHEPTIHTIDERAPDDPERGPLGWLVRVGRLANQAEADALRAELQSQGYSRARAVYSGEDGGKTTGPWVLHVFTIDPSAFEGSLAPELATEIVPERELLTSIAARTEAIASVNAGYFVIGEADGTPGDLAGIYMVGGDLVSESVDGRTSLALPEASGEGATIAELDTEMDATSSDGAHRLVDGLNRKPGLIRSCGGDGGDEPTEQPKHDFTCTDDSELVLFTPAFGDTTEPGAGTEAVLDAEGRVVQFRNRRGGSIPRDGSVLAGTGEGAEWLAGHARKGDVVNVTERLAAGGTTMLPSEELGVVNGGPRLVRAGEINVTAAAEGFHHPENPEFYYRFGVRRNPRTLAGITKDRRLIFIAADGRRPGHSVGLSFEEEALVLQALGARDGLNLDGGGSTGATVGSTLVTRPSDSTGERPIGDALVIGD